MTYTCKIEAGVNGSRTHRIHEGVGFRICEKCRRIGRCQDADQAVHAGGSCSYRALEGNIPVDVIGGMRYNKIDAEAKIDANLFGQAGTVKRSADKHWFDPYVGARVTLPINDKWKGVGYVDIGGSGSGSDFAWQGMAGLIYTYSPSVTVNMGYRYMKIDYDDGGFKYDMANDGLYVGVGLRF